MRDKDIIKEDFRRTIYKLFLKNLIKILHQNVNENVCKQRAILGGMGRKRKIKCWNSSLLAKGPDLKPYTLVYTSSHIVVGGSM